MSTLKIFNYVIPAVEILVAYYSTYEGFRYQLWVWGGCSASNRPPRHELAPPPTNCQLGQCSFLYARLISRTIEILEPWLDMTALVLGPNLVPDPQVLREIWTRRFAR
jgi:hypothetical protein